MPDPYNPWATPVFPGASAFGVGSPAETAERQPTIVDNLLSHIAGALGRGFMAPGQALQSTTPITSEQMIAPAQDMLTLANTGAAAFPASANELRAGMKLYRGEYAGNKGGNFYTGDPEFARQFTQSGRPEEVIRRMIDDSHIHIPEKPIYAGDMDAVDAAIAQAKSLGKRAVQLDEGAGQPPSYFVFDKSALTRR